MCQVLWYGERGIINALVMELRHRGLDGARQFLQVIRWADNLGRDWIERVEKVTYIVEIGLSEFGNPDLILVCRTDAGTRFVVFLEAKVTSYFASAMTNGLGMVPGFNSSINGQLSLKYRCSHALSTWPGLTHLLAEPPGLHAAYVQPPGLGGLGDRCLTPRHLATGNVLQILADHGLQNLPIEQFHYVALTHDDEPFWDQMIRWERPDLLPSLLLPLRLDADDQDELPAGSAWHATRPRLGWLGYGEIQRNLGPGDDYQAAVGTMRTIHRSIGAHESAQQPVDALPILVTTNLSAFPQEQLDRLGQIEEAARIRFGSDAVSRSAGSSSVKRGGVVIIKLLPHKAGGLGELALGIRHHLAPQDWLRPAPSLLMRIGGKPFFILHLPVEPGGNFLADAESIFEQISEQLGLDQEGNALDHPGPG